MISIHIEAHPDRGCLTEQVDRSLAAIGFARQLSSTPGLGASGLVESSGQTRSGEAVPAVSDQSDGSAKVADTPVEKPAPKPRTPRSKKEEPAPTAPTPEPEVEAQDAADEAEESAAEAPKDEDGEVFTLNSVRNAMGDYVKAYGIEFAQLDVPALIGAPKVSAIPDTPEALRKATLAVRAAVTGNPHNRAPASAAA